MTTPTGQISLSDVNVELGKNATDTISLNDTKVRCLADVPSGAISLNNLKGKTFIVFDFATFYSEFNSGGPASAEWIFNSDGTGEVRGYFAVFQAFEWCPCGPIATYEISGNGGSSYVTLTGSVSFGAFLDANSGSISGGFDIRIRKSGTATVIASAVVSFELDSGA
jgi:hypothetical protein